MTDPERITQLEQRVAELEKLVRALARLQGANGETIQISGENAIFRKP